MIRSIRRMAVAAAAFIASSTLLVSVTPTADAVTIEWQKAIPVSKGESSWSAQLQIKDNTIWWMGSDDKYIARGSYFNDVVSAGSASAPTGELMAVEDMRSDGQRVGVKWAVNQRQGVCYFTNGKASSTDWWQYGICDLSNVAEGSTMDYRVGRCDVTAAKDCMSISHWQWGPQRKSYYDDEDNIPDWL